jgi:hypothetical protein
MGAPAWSGRRIIQSNYARSVDEFDSFVNPLTKKIDFSSHRESAIARTLILWRDGPTDIAVRGKRRTPVLPIEKERLDFVADRIRTRPEENGGDADANVDADEN